MNTFLIDKDSPMREKLLEGSLAHAHQDESPCEWMMNNQTGANRQRSPRKNSTNGTKFHNIKDLSMFKYFMLEVTGGDKCKLDGDAAEFLERRNRVYTSVRTPKMLEKFCLFGMMQCLDSILYIVTFLPIRIIFALLRIIAFPFTAMFKRGSLLTAGQTCDLLKGGILLTVCMIVSRMDMSMIYHLVRGQGIIKFYVFFNMLDLLDKMVSGFGQDILDTLYWTAVEPRRKREHFGTLFHFLFSIAYVFLHTMMILTQAVILNVAFNSYNKNLLTIMLSNNFIEIKANLFKRLDKKNLCQIAYSDVKERFHYLILLTVVVIRNLTELEWSWDHAYPILVDGFCVLVVEVIVDWAKHGFITKFNELSYNVYGEFALGLAEDIASSQKKHAFTDFSDQVCRRMGFTPFPLICLLYMVCSRSFSIDGTFTLCLFFLFFICLVCTKVLTGIVILGMAQRLIKERDSNAKSSGLVVNSQVFPKKEEKQETSQLKVDKENQEKNVFSVIKVSSSGIQTDSLSSTFTDMTRATGFRGSMSLPCSPRKVKGTVFKSHSASESDTQCNKDEFSKDFDFDIKPFSKNSSPNFNVIKDELEKKLLVQDSTPSEESMNLVEKKVDYSSSSSLNDVMKDEVDDSTNSELLGEKCNVKNENTFLSENKTDALDFSSGNETHNTV